MHTARNTAPFLRKIVSEHRNIARILQMRDDLVRNVYNFDKLSFGIELWQSAYYNHVKRGRMPCKKARIF